MIWRIYTGRDDGAYDLRDTGQFVEGTEAEAVSMVELIQGQLTSRGLSLDLTWYIVKQVPQHSYGPRAHSLGKLT